MKPFFKRFFSPAFKQKRARHLRLGRKGETVARKLLRELNVDILVVNYRGKNGEIDIIAREGCVLCFVEVKTRTRTGFSRPADAVGREKRKNIIQTANHYMHHLTDNRLAYRFDIIEVVMNARGLKELVWYKSAFSV
jgi:putative endonuclease